MTKVQFAGARLEIWLRNTDLRASIKGSTNVFTNHEGFLSTDELERASLSPSLKAGDLSQGANTSGSAQGQGKLPAYLQVWQKEHGWIDPSCRVFFVAL